MGRVLEAKNSQRPFSGGVNAVLRLIESFFSAFALVVVIGLYESPQDRRWKELGEVPPEEPIYPSHQDFDIWDNPLGRKIGDG